MLSWFNFLLLFFWLTVGAFLLNPSNFISLIFFSEITWVLLYSFSVYCGLLNDDASLISLTFFILGFAGLEFSIVFILVILFKSFSISLDFFDNDKSLKQFSQKYYLKNNIYSFLWV